MKVYWFANPYSPHVRQWLEASSFIDIEIEIFHIHHKSKPCLPINNVVLRSLIPEYLSWLPTILQYLILGCIFKCLFRKDKSIVVHAHNTSGYGFSALVSGFKYIVTTYGSEIYKIKEKSWLYYWLISSILKKAEVITSASPLMTSRLRELLNTETKIREFSLGVSRDFEYSEAKRFNIRTEYKLSENCILFLINRRAAPLYRTYEVINCFLNVFKKSDCKLIVLAGDAEVEYLQSLKELVVQENQVTIIDGFLDQDKLSDLLSASDFFISTPETDQLSSSILEGIMCNSIPILANLSAYDAVKDVSLLVDNLNFEESLNEVLSDLKTIDPDKIRDKVSALSDIKKQFDIAVKANSYKGVLDEFKK